MLYSMDIAEVLKKMDEERYIVKVAARYVVNVSEKVDKSKLLVGTRVALDKMTLTIVRILPREVDPMIYTMLAEDPGKVTFNEIGGLDDQIRTLRESIELPITNPELFRRIGIKAPKGCLMYGPPGTGKTLIARALASNVEAKFLKVVASGIVDKYIGESARTVREMFKYARENAPCIIFIDEIDAIAGKRFSEGTSADREIQRTLMELLNQIDGFDELNLVKVVFATNRPDVLDPAFLRPGRIDRKVEIPLPNELARLDIIKIHSKKITTKGDINFEGIAKISEDFNGADLRNVCTEAGMYAIRAGRDYVVDDDFFKAARKIKDVKKLETKLDYQKM
jgi:26S proteasome regulatory subunit T4